MRIRLHQHPLAGASPQEFEAESLALWLLDRYGAAPAVSVQVFTGEPSVETEITGQLQAIMWADQPVYTVLESPGGPLTPFIPQIIMFVASLALNYLMAPRPEAVGNRDQQSPNNQLSNRQNQVRTMERVEDIFGTVRSIPSLLMPTYSKYVQNVQVEFGYYCVGRGYHVIDELRDGDTPLVEISGAAASVYAPFTSPNSGTPQLEIGDPIDDLVVTVTRSGSVDGILLKAENQLQLQADQNYIFYPPGMGGAIFGIGDLPISATDDTIFQPVLEQRRPNFAAVAEIGQSLTISMAAVPMTVTATLTDSIVLASNTFTRAAGAFADFAVGMPVTSTDFGTGNNVTRTITAKAGDSSSITVGGAALTDEVSNTGSLTVYKDYSATRTITGVGNGYVTLNGTSSFFHYYYGGVLGAPAVITISNGLSEWTDWFTLPSADRTEVWTNTRAPNGLYKDDGAKQATTVEYEVQIEKLTALLVPTGIVETVTGSLVGSTSNDRGETLEQVTAWTGPARVRARRTTPFDYFFAGLVVDEISWVDLYGVSPVDKLHFGNKTTIHTVTRGNPDATALRRRELNCRASRKLPTYNGSVFSGAFDADGAIASGTIAATSKIVDIIAAVALDPEIGNRDVSELDMAQIWGVQQALDAWNAECGQFNFTFDSDGLSFEETINTIANAAFCSAYRQNGKTRLALDRPQATSVALFTHRNKKPPAEMAERITRKFASDSEYDGIELMYQDPETEKQETIRLPLDGSYTKLKRVEVPGIRSYEQAWLRANREYNRLTHQRLTIETEVTTDARALLPNVRADIVDNTRFKSFDGEVVGQSGLTLTLSRDVEFIPATAHSIVLMKRDGSLQSIACTAGPAANQVVLGTTPAEALVTQRNAADGIRTIFSFAADSARGAMAWLVQEIGLSDGQYIKLRAVNYHAQYYAADGVAIPAKEGVIF